MSWKADRVYPMIFLFAMLAVTAWLLYSMMLPFLNSIFVAFVIAVAWAPAHRRLKRYIRKEAAAALVSTVLVMVLVLAPFVGLLAVFAQQGLAAYQHIAAQTADEGGWGGWLAHKLEQPILWMSERTGLTPPRIRETAAGWIESLSRRILGWSGVLAGNLGATLSGAVIVFFTLFFFLLEGKRLEDAFITWLPLERGKAQRLLSVTFDTIKANLFGIVAVSGAQGALAAIGFLFVGMNAWLFWGIVAAFASLLPIVGAAIIWLPVAVQLLIAGSWGKALFLAIWGVLVIGMADNVIRPLVVSGRTELSTLTVFFALLGGLNAFGLIGLIAGPLVFTLAITLYRILDEMRREESAGGEAAATS